MKLLLCDDHALFRDGLKGALAPLGAGFAEATSADEAFAILERERDISLALLDLSMPGSDPWQTLARMRRDHPACPVVIVSATEDAETVRRALGSGASGFIPKSSSAAVIVKAVELVRAGGVYLPPQLLRAVETASPSVPEGPAPARRRRPANDVLTSRQWEVAELMSRGLTNAEIGNALGIAPGTVKAHISAILDALDVTNRTEAVLAVQEQLGKT